MSGARVLILGGTGINCERETAEAFARVGGRSEIVHTLDLLESPQRLGAFQIFVVPGGFSYADDTGAGNALAHRLRLRVGDRLHRFVENGGLVLGICNGFQVLVRLGLLPGPAGDAPIPAALLPNEPAGYQCRWVDLRIEESRCVFVPPGDPLRLPVAHGEGRFFAEPAGLRELESNEQVVLRYAGSDGKTADGTFPANPNGSTGDIAGICDATGRVFGLMPHPERGMDFFQRDDWPRIADRLRRDGRPLPVEGDGLAIFRSAVRHFEK